MSYTEDADEPDDHADQIEGWLCVCGHWNDHDWRCDLCRAEPPWGCDDDSEEWDEDEDFWDGEECEEAYD